MAPTAAHLKKESKTIQLLHCNKVIETYLDQSITFSFQAPGLGNFKLTTRAELGMFKSSLRPCSTPTTRPEQRAQEQSLIKVKYVVTFVTQEIKQKSAGTIDASTKGIAELNLGCRSTERHGDLPKAWVKGHFPFVLLGTVMVGREQVDFHGLNCLLDPL